MNGYENIISEIKRETDGEIEKILAESRAEAEKLVSAASDEADAKFAEVISEANKKAAVIRDSAVSSAGSLEKRAVLAAKNQSRLDFFQRYREELSLLPDKEYFSKLAKLVGKYAVPGKKGEILLAEGDAKKRDRKEFAASLRLAGVELLLSEECAPGGEGCIIKYGRTEENLLLDSVFEDLADTLTDKLNKAFSETENE